MVLPSVYVVLGMHKSGTTLVASALHRSGVTMVPPEQRVPESYDRGGKFEWKEFREHNRALLSSDPKDSLGIDLRSALETFNADPATARALIERTAQRFPAWGFKDPCTTLLYPFWRKILPAHQVVAIYRRPEEVCRHYFKQHACGGKLWAAAEAHRHWEFYNRQILKYCEEGPRPIALVNFECLLDGDDEWKRLERFTGRRLRDVRDRSLYRCQVERRSNSLMNAREGGASTVLERLEQLRRTQCCSV